MRDIAFATRLTESDWDETFRGWRCPVLNVPGSIIEDLYVDGNRVDKSKYEVLQEHLIVRWVPEERPDRVTAAIKFTEQLSLGRETDKWKRLAVILPVLATIGAASISGTATYLSARAKAPIAPASAEGHLAPLPAATTPEIPSLENEEFAINMPRGDKVVVWWKNMPTDGPGDEILTKNGISLSDVDAGTKLAYAALAKKTTEAIRYGPLVFGYHLADGYSHSVMRAGPAEGAGYVEFQLFQHTDDFVILIETGDEKAAPIPPEKIGIDWGKVREGLNAALVALYKGKKQFDFDSVALLVQADGSWQYRIPYRARN